jgi:rod shape-determining protein MreD
MNAYLTFLLLLVVTLLQSTVMSRIAIFGVHPDLMLMVVTSWSLLRGTQEGMLWALSGGVSMDLLSGARFGLHTLALLIVSFATGFGERTIFRFEILMPILVIPIATLGYQVALMGGLFLFGWPVVWGTYMITVVLPSMLANTVCMPVVYLIVRVLHRRTHHEEMVV